MRRAVPLLAAFALLPGCGGEAGPPAPGPAPPQATGDPEPSLPRGWQRVRNRRDGFSFGIPPGWKARREPGATLVRSRDRALAISVTADRSAASVGQEPGPYARAVAGALSGYRGLDVGTPEALADAPYPGASVEASGTFETTGVRQRILVIALARASEAKFALTVFRSARVPRRRYARALEGLVRSFRAVVPEGSRAVPPNEPG